MHRGCRTPDSTIRGQALALLPPLMRLERGKRRILARILPPLRGSSGRGCATPPRARVRRGPGRGLPPRPRPGRPDSARAFSTAPENAAASPSGTSHPPAPWTTTAPTPRASPAITGTPSAWASSIAMPIGSPSAGHTKRSQALTIPCSAAPRRAPRQVTRPADTSPANTVSTSGRAGPSPATSRCHGTCRIRSRARGQQPERFRLAPAAHHRDTGEERRRGIGAHRTRDTCATARAVAARHAGLDVDERCEAAKSCAAAGRPFEVGHVIREVTGIIGEAFEAAGRPFEAGHVIRGATRIMDEAFEAAWQPLETGHVIREFTRVTSGIFEAAEQPFQTGHVVRVERDHPTGTRERGRDGAMAVPPRAACLLRRVRRLCDEVGDPQPGADTRADPVRRLVVEVVREPAPRRPGRAEPTVDQPPRLCPPDTRQPALAGSVADAVERPQPRRQRHFVAGPLQRAHQQPGDESITRRSGVIRRLERRVERDPHDPDSWMVAAPEPGAGRARRLVDSGVFRAPAGRPVPVRPDSSAASRRQAVARELRRHPVRPDASTANRRKWMSLHGPGTGHFRAERRLVRIPAPVSGGRRHPLRGDVQPPG